MPHIAIETNLWDTDEAIELGRLVGDPDAWRFVARLWAWGIDANCESGVISLPPERVKSIANFGGDSVTLFDALVATGYLVPRANGRYYMRGWSRTKRYFQEKKRTRERMRKYRERLRSDGSSDANVTRNNGVTFGGDPDRDPDRDRDRDQYEREISSGDTHVTRNVTHVDQVIQAVFEAKLGLSRPGNELAGRIHDTLPMPRERLVTAIDATSKADHPNWTFLLKCLESPFPQHKKRESRFEAMQRAGDDFVNGTHDDTEWRDGPSTPARTEEGDDARR